MAFSEWTASDHVRELLQNPVCQNFFQYKSMIYMVNKSEEWGFAEVPSDQITRWEYQI
jgi:uncharacterized C2H2 Zn-finger protein